MPDKFERIGCLVESLRTALFLLENAALEYTDGCINNSSEDWRTAVSAAYKAIEEIDALLVGGM